MKITVQATFSRSSLAISLAATCILLPVENTTAEKLAEYIAHRLLEELQRRKLARPQRLQVEVDECYGQIGVCETS